MGFIVTCDEKEVWSPSLTVGNIFYEQISSLEKIIEKESGVTYPFDDELEIDKEKFEIFINESAKFLNQSENAPLIAMLSGCLEVAVYLYFLITDVWLETPTKLNFLSDKARAMAGI